MSWLPPLFSLLLLCTLLFGLLPRHQPPPPAPPLRVEALGVDFEAPWNSPSFRTVDIHPSEYSDQGGVAWTSSSRPKLVLAPLESGTYLAQFSVRRALLPQQIPAFALQVNGQPVSLTSTRSRFPYTASGLVQLAGSGPTRIEWQAPEAQQPSALGLGKDSRRLGVLLDEVSLTPFPGTQQASSWQYPEGQMVLFNPGPRSHLLLAASAAPQVILNGRPLTLRPLANAFEAPLPDAPQGALLQFQVRGAFQQLWVYDPQHLRCPAQAIPVQSGWSSCVSDGLARPFRRIGQQAITLPLQLRGPGPVTIRIRLLRRNHPDFPVYLPVRFVPAPPPRLELTLGDLPVPLDCSSTPWEHLYQGQVHQLPERPVALTLSAPPNTAVSSLDITPASAPSAKSR